MAADQKTLFLRHPVDAIQRVIWSDYFDKLGPLSRFVGTVLRYLYALLRDIFSGELNLRAMSLVYTTLLSIVPLLAFSFALLKGFGVFEQLRPYLQESLAPLGARGDEIADTLLSLVDNVKGGVLGGVSMLILLWTVVSTIQKIESSLNYVWYVSKPRSMARRFTEYVVILIIGPVIMVTAVTIIGSMGSNSVVQYLRSLPGAGELLLFAGKLVPMIMISGMFTFLYIYLPNTRVRFVSALVGGLSGGLMWATMAMIFTTFVVTATRTQNMYANFAVAIFALIWLYLNWLVLLIGAQLAFYHQNPAYLRIGRQVPRLSNSMRERLALNIMSIVGQAFRKPKQRVTPTDIGARLNIPTIAIMPVITALEEDGLLVTTEDEYLIPGKDIARTSLNDVLAVVRVEGKTGSHGKPRWSRDIDALGQDLDDAIIGVLNDRSLADLLDEVEKKD
jgi:membrane protein